MLQLDCHFAARTPGTIKVILYCMRIKAARGNNSV